MSTRRKKTSAGSPLIVPRSIEVHPHGEKARVLVAADDPKLLEIDFTAVRPIRRIATYQGQRHKPVFAYVEACQDHVACESRLEARVLMEMDFEGLVAAVASQPFTLRYTAGDREYRHTPDFAIADASGEVSIVDVKPAELQDTEKNLRDFHATAQWCQRMGFTYRVEAGFGETQAATIRYLAHNRNQPPAWHTQAPVVLSMLDLHGAPVIIKELLHRAANALDVPSPVVIPTVYCLMWNGYLDWDHSRELQPDLPVRKSRDWDEVSA